MNAFFLHPQNRAKGILFIFLVTNFLLVSCTNQTSENTTQTSSNTYTSTSQSSDSLIASSDGVTVKVIKVMPNCIGCGKCAHIDSVHFKINSTTHKAEPIQASGNDSALERAIDHCPVSAITTA